MTAGDRHVLLRYDAGDGAIPPLLSLKNADLSNDRIRKRATRGVSRSADGRVRLLEDKYFFFRDAQKCMRNRQTRLASQFGVEKDVFARRPAGSIKKAMGRWYAAGANEAIGGGTSDF